MDQRDYEHGGCRRASAVLGLLFLVIFGLGAVRAEACFGKRLRIAVPKDARGALAAYAAGFFIEEKTGIEPEFVESADRGLADGTVDLRLAAGGSAVPAGGVVGPAGEVPGTGPAQFWIRDDVLEDLRFFTVERTLGKMPAFYASRAFHEALESPAPPKKAARKAVLDAK